MNILATNHTEHKPIIRILSDSLVSMTLADGSVDFYRICDVHQWGSRGVVSRDLAEQQQCRKCAAELDSIEGERRYRVLHDALVLQPAPSQTGMVH